MGKEETEELIKIFVTSIKTAEKKSRLGVIGRSMFDVRCSFFSVPPAQKQFSAYGPGGFFVLFLTVTLTGS
jgi:hypothetical protein